MMRGPARWPPKRGVGISDSDKIKENETEGREEEGKNAAEREKERHMPTALHDDGESDAGGARVPTGGVSRPGEARRERAGTCLRAAGEERLEPSSGESPLPAGGRAAHQRELRGEAGDSRVALNKGAVVGWAFEEQDEGEDAGVTRKAARTPRERQNLKVEDQIRTEMRETIRGCGYAHRIREYQIREFRGEKDAAAGFNDRNAGALANGATAPARKGRRKCNKRTDERGGREYGGERARSASKSHQPARVRTGDQPNVQTRESESDGRETGVSAGAGTGAYERCGLDTAWWDVCEEANSYGAAVERECDLEYGV
ncbi:hypothetical protein DFH09DRAFT_1285213 [Mycena vulgaris]|nr:hypothetical protein DFH09DRAFT_1285213 [Mycena vulgaris]